MKVDLTGKCAFVTGGSGDIGRAICAALARAGARVAFTYFSDREGADQTVAAIAEHSPKSSSEPASEPALAPPPAPPPDPPEAPIVIRVNFADQKSTARALEQVRAQLPHVDIFVSNAASGVLRPLSQLKQRHFQWTIDVNARAFFTMAQGITSRSGDASPLMTRGGRIVALSSLGATRAIPQYTVVGASKAALESLTRHLALDLGPLGINVNAVSPGIVETKALQAFPNREQLLDVASRRTPIGRLTRPDDIAKVVLFLCSEAAAMIHGQTIHVDGGYTVVA